MTRAHSAPTVPGAPHALARLARAAAHPDVLLAAVSLAAVAIPFLAVRYPPISDLPQQASQIRLFADAWNDPGGTYRISWTNPNRLSYLFLGAGWLLFGPVGAGRFAMLAIGALWVAAAHVLARRRGRPAEAAVLASVLFFNHATYWGFYSFLAGLPAFVLFFHFTDRVPDPLSWKHRAYLFGSALLLFLTHALWFAAALAWLGVSTLASRGARATASRLVTVAPLVAWAVAWNGTLRGSPFDAPPVWKDLAIRWQPEWLVEATLGGLRGDLETALAAVLAGWVLLGLLRARPREVGWDRAMLGAAAGFLVAALVLPNRTHNTIQFAERWMPVAAFFAVLAAPALRWRRAAAALVAAVALGYGASTAVTWRDFERTELSGLEQSVAAVPGGARVLGLDLVKKSAFVDGYPFLQTFAYAQLMHGGSLAFTFAVFPSSLVNLRRPRKEPWTPNLVWYAERAKRKDVEHFEYVLVNALDDADHARVAAAHGLARVTATGRWRLFRVAPLRRDDDDDVAAETPRPDRRVRPGPRGPPRS